MGTKTMNIMIENVDDCQQQKTFKAHDQITDARESALRRYQNVIVGSPSLWFTFKYELICWLGNCFPAAIGLWLRSKLYPLLFKHVGKGVVFGSDLILRHPNKIEISDNVVIADRCTLDARGTHLVGITIGEGSIIGDSSMIRCKNGRIAIGRNVGINAGVILCAVEGNSLEIGDDSTVGPYSYLDGSQYHHDRLDVPTRLQGLQTKGGIKIGTNTFLGAKVTVVDGVSIGSDSIIGAAALVRENIPDRVIVTPHQRLVMLPREQNQSD
jgi:acetyltransferase-like isoleucine patch superfamily enzyme